MSNLFEELKRRNVVRVVVASMAAGLLLAGCSDEPEKTAPERETPDQKAALMAIADSYLDERLKYSPGIAYFVDLPLEHHDGLNDISPKAMARWQAYEDKQLTELNKIDAEALLGTPEWILLGQMREMLEASIGLRDCRRELWSVNHMGGFYNGLGRLAGRQPVGTPELRADALVRFTKVAGYVENDIANLRRGVELGYLSPKNAVGRVIRQVDGLLGLPLEKSPLLAPVRADDDEAFGEEFTALIRDEVLPAFKAYRDFLENEYLDQARTEKGVGANPDGRECFIASYRSYTTLKRTPEEVFELGKATVDGYRDRVVEVGQRLYGVSDFTEILKRVADDPANQFANGEEVEAAYNAVVAKAEAAMAGAFPKPPRSQIGSAALSALSGRNRYERPLRIRDQGQTRGFPL